LDRVLTVSEPFDVRDVSACLDSKKKLPGCSSVPPLKHRFFDEPVKGDVEFYRVKTTAVEFEPFTLRNTLRIEDPPAPVRVIVAACSDAKLFH